MAIIKKLSFIFVIAVCSGISLYINIPAFVVASSSDQSRLSSPLNTMTTPGRALPPSTIIKQNMPADIVSDNYSSTNTRILFSATYLNIGGNIAFINEDGTGYGQYTFMYGGCGWPGTGEGEYAISPDGNKIGFTSDVDSDLVTELCVMDLRDNYIYTIREGRVRSYRWSPDGNKVAFDISLQSSDHGSELYVANCDGTGLIRVGGSYPNCIASYSGFSWFPDSAKIAFDYSDNVTDQYSPHTDIYACDSDGSNLINLTNSPAHYSKPEVSPDGLQIAFHASLSTGAYSGIYLMGSDGSNLRQLFSINYPDRNVQWSPDSLKLYLERKLSFTGTTSYEIFVVNADGSNLHQVSFFQGGASIGKWSPDGNKIAFLSNGQDNYREVYLVNADGTGLRNLSNNIGNLDLFTGWTPDNKVLFTSSQGSITDIYLSDAYTHTTIKLTDGTGNNNHPGWLQAMPDSIVPPGSAPFDLRVTPVRDDQVNLSWQQSTTDHIGFKIEKQIGSGSFKTIAFVKAAQRQFSEYGLTPNNVYRYRVSAYNLAGYTSCSNVAVVKTGKTAPGYKIAFESVKDSSVPETGRKWEIYTMNDDGADQARLTNNVCADHAPYWSHDCTKIAYISEPAEIYDVFSMNTDGTLQTQLTNNDVSAGIAIWSPDGSKILFSKSIDLWVMDSDGSNQANLTNSSGDEVYAASYEWSPDGSKIAYAYGPNNYNITRQIAVMNADGSNKTDLTSAPKGGKDPVWSPDGTKIAYFYNKDIYIADLETGIHTRLIADDYWRVQKTDPVWLPGGDALLVTITYTDPGVNVAHGIYRVNTAGTIEHFYTGIPYPSYVQISPDSSTISFYEDSVYKGYVTMYVDGSSKTRICDHGASYRKWSPLPMVFPPDITTENCTEITANSSRLNMTVSSFGTDNSTQVYFLWGTASDNYTGQSAHETLISTGTYHTRLTGLNRCSTYFYRAVAIGDKTAYGEELSFQTTADLPALVTNNATSISSSSAILNGFVSEDGGEACKYRFCRGTASGVYTDNTTWSTDTRKIGQSFSTNITGLTSGTTYYYVAQAKNSAGTGSGTEKIFTTTCTKPGAPTLSSPVNGASVSGSTSTFAWTAGTGSPTKYWLQVNTNSTFTGTNKYYAQVNGTSQSVSGLPANGSTLYWRVQAGNTCGWSPWSTSRSFTNTVACTNPGAPTLSSPANAGTVAGTSVTFTWAAGTGTPTKYWLQVNSNSGFTGTNYYYADVGNVTSKQITTLPANGSTLYWRVWAGNTCGWCSDAAAAANKRSFTNSAACTRPGAPTLSTTAPGASVTGTTATFAWTAGTGTPTKYWLQVNSNSGFTGTNYYYADVGNVTSKQITTLPANGSTLYWRVQPYNACGWGTWSNTQYFNNNMRVIVLELTWDGWMSNNNSKDLDSHFIRPGGTMYSSDGDCYYAYLDQDWGVYGNATHSGDDQWGDLGERTTLNNTGTGTYNYQAFYINDYGQLGNPVATTTAKIYVNGVLKDTRSVSMTQGQVWNIWTIAYSTATNDATVTYVGTVAEPVSGSAPPEAKPYMAPVTGPVPGSVPQEVKLSEQQ